jgi:AbrB family looped-hinge helix DNA binding protein
MASSKTRPGKQRPHPGESASDLVRSVKEAFERAERTQRWVEVSEDGEIVLPEDMREQLGIEPGRRVLLEIEGNTLLLLTSEAAFDRAQERMRPLLEGTPSLVDELLAERRREAELE